jgi:tetratricopeptide (TPR) repeat protein
LQLKQDTLAIKDFDKVLSIDPDNTTAHSDRGIANTDLGQYYAAIFDFGDAIRAMEKGDIYLPNNYENRADAYVKVQDYRQAIEDYSSAIELRIDTQVILLSLAQFRGLYPEYAVVSDDALLQKLNHRFAPQYEADAFRKLLTQDNGKWGISLLNDLYEKRGDAYLSVGDFRRGIVDFQRIFVGMPDYGKFTERWRSLGAFGHGEKYYLDVKASEPLSDRFPRIWVKRIGAKQSEVTSFELDCSSRRLRVTTSIVYDAIGNTVGSSDVGEGWSYVAPDTLGEQLWNGVCQSKP